MKKLLFSFAALAALAACTEESKVEPVPNPSESFQEVSFVANAQTKTHLDENNNVIWDANDAVALKFTASSGLKIVNFTTAEGGESATFKATLTDDVTTSAGYSDNVFAVYPASAMHESGEIPVALPATTTVAPGSFPSGANLTSAVLSLDDLRAGTATANFVNAYAIIRFTLPANVKSVKMVGTAPLAGTAMMEFKESTRLTVKNFNSPSNSVILNDADGDALEAGKVYNILVYPGTHTSMTVELTDSDGCTYSKTVTGVFKFEAANYYTFNFNAAFTQEFSFTVSGLEVTDGEKIVAVFNDGETAHAKEAVVNTNSFTVQFPHGMNATSGYAVYPSSVYSEGNIAFNLQPTTTDVAFYWGAISMADYKVTLAAAKPYGTLNFTVPAGVASYKITSTQPLYGPSVVTVSESGLNVAPTSEAVYTYEGTVTGAMSISVYPQTNATFTAVLYDGAGASFACTSMTDASLPMGGSAEYTGFPETVDFAKSGSFTTEDFGNGGKYEF